MDGRTGRGRSQTRGDVWVRVRVNKLCLVRALIPQVTQSNIRTKFIKKNMIIEENKIEVQHRKVTPVTICCKMKGYMTCEMNDNKGNGKERQFSLKEDEFELPNS